jgi:ATP-binding cassette subfamily B protein
MTAVAVSPEPAPADRSLLRRGARLLWISVREHPRPFAVSVLGSVLYGSMAVAGSLLLGEITDRIIVPGFDEGVSGATIAAGAGAILAEA